MRNGAANCLSKKLFFSVLVDKPTSSSFKVLMYEVASCANIIVTRHAMVPSERLRDESQECLRRSRLYTTQFHSFSGMGPLFPLHIYLCPFFSKAFTRTVVIPASRPSDVSE